MEKYLLPKFLKNILSPKDYRKWLENRANALHRRDKANNKAIGPRSKYKELINKAVCRDTNVCHHTGWIMDWSLINLLDDKEAQAKRNGYKRKFDMLPTVDHEWNGKNYDFSICCWIIHDIKNNLSMPELIDVCGAVVRHYTPNQQT